MYPTRRPSGEQPQQGQYPPYGSSSPRQPAAHASPYANPPPPARSGLPPIGAPPHSPHMNRNLPPSPTTNRAPYAQAPHSRASTGYYDPTMDSRQRSIDHEPKHHSPRSPQQVRTNIALNLVMGLNWTDWLSQGRPLPYGGPIDRTPDMNGLHANAPAPNGYAASSYHSDPYARQESAVAYTNGYQAPPVAVAPQPKPLNVRLDHEKSNRHATDLVRQPPTPRNSNPMSMSNLLSDSAPAPAPAPVPPPPTVAPAVMPSPPRRVSHPDTRPVETVPLPITKVEIAPALQDRDIVSPAPVPSQAQTDIAVEPTLPTRPPASVAPAVEPSPPKAASSVVSRQNSTPSAPAPYPLPSVSGPPDLSVRATEAAFAEIEAREDSDVDMPGFEAPREEYRSRSQKRALDMDYKEAMRRKVCDPIVISFLKLEN